MDKRPENLIANGDFRLGAVGGPPNGWQVSAARPVLCPHFELASLEGRAMLLARGNGHQDCVGYASQRLQIPLGRTLRFRVVFRVSEDVNPQRHLLFRCVLPGAKDGIFRFRQSADGWATGETHVTSPGEGVGEAEVQVFFRFNAQGQAWIREVSLSETEPVPPRWVRVACTQGKTDLDACTRLLQIAGDERADLVLLPEYLRGGLIPEPVSGPSGQLMSEMARQHGMYVAGGIVRQAAETDRIYNTCLLYDREGNRVGMYDKVHPYSPENNEQGITAGREVPVFKTDFGTVGMMICYDSWFPDVCQLLALRGAEIVLFPNAGHQPEFLHARAGDNGVRIVSSAWNLPCSIYDTLGRNIRDDAQFVTAPSPNMRTFKDVTEHRLTDPAMALFSASLDLQCSPAPAYNGGTMMAAPAGRRNRLESTIDLQSEIREELDRWWEQ